MDSVFCQMLFHAGDIIVCFLHNQCKPPRTITDSYARYPPCDTVTLRLAYKKIGDDARDVQDAQTEGDTDDASPMRPGHSRNGR